ncbi:hypothetical protein T310_8747, partial [Rasamsonia emersonii CBS 393.64]
TFTAQVLPFLLILCLASLTSTDRALPWPALTSPFQPAYLTPPQASGSLSSSLITAHPRFPWARFLSRRRRRFVDSSRSFLSPFSAPIAWYADLRAVRSLLRTVGPSLLCRPPPPISCLG